LRRGDSAGYLTTSMPWHLRTEDVWLLPPLARAGWSLLRRRGQTVGSLVRERAQATPDRVFLRFEAESVTWGAFNDGVNAFAAVFRQAGVGREPVALMMENSPTLLMAQIAAAKTGAIAALINTHLSGAALTSALRASTARHVFTDSACLARAAAPPESASLTLWGQGDPAALPPHIEPLDAALAAAPRAEPNAPAIGPDDPFLYLFTAGTTGNARPTLVRHRRFSLAGVAQGALLHIGADDVVYAPLPLYHGLANLVGFSVAAHAGAVFASRRRYTAAHCLDDIHQHHATALVYAGELCRYLLGEPPRADDRSHRLRLAVGAGMRPDVWAPFRDRFAVPRIVEMYGQTEGNVALLNLTGSVGSVGRPLPGLRGDVRLARCAPESGDLVRNDAGFLVECDAGEAGELLSRVRERSLMPLDGYVDPKVTALRVVGDAFRRGDRWFRSGDLLRRDGDGRFTLVDRIRDALRCRGALVSTLEVADTLNGKAGVSETNAFAVTLPGRSEPVLMAAVVLARGARFDGAAFYAAGRILAPAARPVFVRVVPVMDVTGVLKQRKSELQRQGYDPTRLPDPLFVRDDTGETYVPLTGEGLARIRAGTWVVSDAGDG
jgi:fatty-acyl-CoA synthase